MIRRELFQDGGHPGEGDNDPVIDGGTDPPCHLPEFLDIDVPLGEGNIKIVIEEIEKGLFILEVGDTHPREAAPRRFPVKGQ